MSLLYEARKRSQASFATTNPGSAKRWSVAMNHTFVTGAAVGEANALISIKVCYCGCGEVLIEPV